VLKQLLKLLYQFRHDNVNLVLWRDSDPDHPSSYSFAPIIFIVLWGLTLVGVSFVIGFILYITPLGDRIFNREDEGMRAEIVALGQRVMAIQDSLDMRDAQLDNIKQVLYEGTDTTFMIQRASGAVADTQSAEVAVVTAPAQARPTRSIATSNMSFPLRLPLRGRQTRGFEPDQGHFGVDLSTNRGESVYASADGAILSSEWTMNYGFVVKIQHADGYVSVLKHMDRPLKTEGSVVRRGDLIGFVSNTGIISSGPHLHVELWKDGVPLNPDLYFTQR
jgi:murein DD-endopeptidase MepM/ murein hydrolase activator NlpD